MISRLLTRHIYYVHMLLNHIAGFVLIYFWLRAICLSILHLIERDGLYASGMVCLICLGYLVPLPIWTIVSIFHCMEGHLGWCMLIFYAELIYHKCINIYSFYLFYYTQTKSFTRFLLN